MLLIILYLYLIALLHKLSNILLIVVVSFDDLGGLATTLTKASIAFLCALSKTSVLRKIYVYFRPSLKTLKFKYFLPLYLQMDALPLRVGT